MERNPKQANLVKRAESWQWSSIWRRENGTAKQQEILSDWPVKEPKNYLTYLNKPQSEKEEEAIELAIDKGRPFGKGDWLNKIVKKFGLESTLRSPGRPKNGG